MIHRRHTRPVRVGGVVIGAGAPIVIQSMTTTTPENLEGSLAQIRALQAAGCGIVRLAVPSIEAARALGPLREGLRARGIDTPLVADVHFNPRAAYEAARHVEKVRINPGNFATSPEEGRRRLVPLLDLLREPGSALRIGVNHGSLAPYISGAYGHGPRGMVASALEYLRFCRDAGFEQLVVALKASNPAVMVAANRLLAESLRAEGMDYPIHLGVTEAGADEEGVLRSALGIGALLLEGIGDTIRVSLTGDPVPEIDACRRILRAVEAEGAWGPVAVPLAVPPAAEASRWGDLLVGAAHPPRVELALPPGPYEGARPRQVAEVLDRALAAGDRAAESLLFRDGATCPHIAGGAGGSTRGAAGRVAPTTAIWQAWPPEDLGSVPDEVLAAVTGLHIRVEAAPQTAPPVRQSDLEGLARRCPRLLLRWELALTVPPSAPPSEGGPGAATWLIDAAALARRLSDLTRAAGLARPAFVLAENGAAALGRALAAPPDAGAQQGVAARPLLCAWLPADPVRAAVALGPLLLDRLIDVVIVESADGDLRPAYDLLQVTRRRMLRADFISCPGCGRLAYDIEAALRRLKARCGHLAGVKIAVMGCTVNGPGEMADADVGYVGSAAGKVDVYAGRERGGRGRDPVGPEALLIELLEARGLWREPPARQDHEAPDR